MLYAHAEYHLGQVTPSIYARAMRDFSFRAEEYELVGAHRQITGASALEVAEDVLSYSRQLPEASERGEPQYLRALNVGIMALRAVSPVSLQPRDWTLVISYDLERQLMNPGISLAEFITLAFAEIACVNQGYVRGHYEAFSAEDMADAAVLSGLGAIHAHDLIHFGTVPAV